MKNSKLFYSFVIVVILIFTITYSVFGETIEELNQQKNEILNKIEDSNNQLSGVEDNINGVNAQIEKLNNQISKYQNDLNESDLKVAQMEKSVTAIKTELKKAEDAYIYQKKLLEQRLVVMYEAGDTMYLDVLLTSKSVEDFLSKFYYLTKMAEYDQKLMKEVNQAKQNIENKQVLLEKEYQKLKVEKENNEKLVITFENLKVVVKSYLNELIEKQKDFQEKIEEYEKEFEKVQKEILNVALQNIGEEYIGGELAWPTPGYTTITSGYGMRIHPIFYVYRLHTGVDIGAPSGAPIIAVNDGTVILASSSISYGNYVMIDHGGGVVTLYAHGSRICVTEGESVKKGDMIMLVGSTGWSTGYHLHFEVRINGQTYDPLPYITSNKMPSTNEIEDKEDENAENTNEIIENQIVNTENIIN